MKDAGMLKTGARDSLGFIAGSVNPFELARPRTEAEAPLEKVLVVATDGATRGRVDQRLEEEFEVTLVKSAEEALAQMKTGRFALALLDLRESGERVKALVQDLRGPTRRCR
jgi:ActR/RegA family two-component response regulator